MSPLTLPPPAKPAPPNPTLSDLPRNAIANITQRLPLRSLLALSRASKRYHRFITCAPELQAHLFKVPPAAAAAGQDNKVSKNSGDSSEGEKEQVEQVLINYVHPVFRKLHFFAYNPVTAVRLGEDGPYLSTKKVKSDFATYPAVVELGVRVLSGGTWKWDEEVCVENPKGITVWDVVQQVTEFLNSYSDPAVSFLDRFGEAVCKKRGYAPKVVMMNYEFLNPMEPFPKFLFPNPNDRLQIVADYTFSKFAMQPLVLMPPSPSESPSSFSLSLWSSSSSSDGDDDNQLTIPTAFLGGIPGGIPAANPERTRHRTGTGIKKAAGKDKPEEKEVWVAVKGGNSASKEERERPGIKLPALRPGVKLPAQRPGVKLPAQRPGIKLPALRPEGKKWHSWKEMGEKERKEQWIEAMNKRKEQAAAAKAALQAEKN